MELKKHWKITFSRDEQHFVQGKSKSIFLKLKTVLIFDCDGVILDSEVIADRILLEHLSNLLNPFPNNLFPSSDFLKEWLSRHSGQSDKEISLLDLQRCGIGVRTLSQNKDKEKTGAQRAFHNSTLARNSELGTSGLGISSTPFVTRILLSSKLL